MRKNDEIMANNYHVNCRGGSRVESELANTTGKNNEWLILIKHSVKQMRKNRTLLVLFHQNTLAGRVLIVTKINTC